jgi:hypothetical protein
MNILDEENKIKEKRECEVCKKEKSKYQCPGCKIYFCSVECNKTHKKESQCTGERDKTKYIDLKDFKDNDLISGKNSINKKRFKFSG